MLTLKNIGKDYTAGRAGVHALRCVNLVCRPRELIMVVGGNGSGKSTLLRIMSAQIPHSRGEILIDGKSSRKFSDNQWSAYRRRVVLVDPAALMPDRTLLENAALGLRLSGHRRTIRREQAMEMLQFFGMEALAGRYPGELSSGQRKLAALACALTSEPEVLLIDEPVLGLDAATAKKVLGILRETARHGLVITASRKPIFPEGEVRTLHIKDGLVDSDSDPCPGYKEKIPEREREKGLPFGGALSLALSQLRHGGGRVISRVLTGFLASFCAASVLIFTGAMLDHSAKVQQSTLSVYPIYIHAEDMSPDAMQELFQWLNSRDDLPDGTEIQPVYGTTPWAFVIGDEGSARQVNPTAEGLNLWAELPDNPELRQARYQLLTGRWPERYDEVVVIQNARGAYTRAGLESIGVKPDEESGEWIAPGYDHFLHTTFRLVLPVQTYYPNADGTWGDLREDAEYMTNLMERVPSLKIVGIVRPAADTADTRDDAFIGYSRAMTNYIAEAAESSELVRAQTASPSVDVVSGLPFDTKGLHTQSPADKASAMLEYIQTLDEASVRFLCEEITGRAAGEQDALHSLTETIAALPAEDAAALYDSHVLSKVSPATYEQNLEYFGVSAASRIISIRLYASSLDARQQLTAILDDYTGTLEYSDEVETMAASAARYAAGLEKLRIVLSVAAILCSGAALSAAYAGAVTSRRRRWMLLRSRGMSRQELMQVCLWESGILALFTGVLGVGSAWLSARPICHLIGWPQLAESCSLVLLYGIILVALLLTVSVAAAVLTVGRISVFWPRDMLNKGKE